MSKNIIWDAKEPSRQLLEGKWLGKLVMFGSPHVRVELRKTFRFQPANMFSQVLVKVGLGKEYTDDPQVSISMNGATPMTLAELKTMHGAIIEAHMKLKAVDL